MAAIFISYRREDSAGYTGRLFDALSAHFGKDEVFMDVDDIKAGEDFVKVIEETEKQCLVLLAVIGKSWVSTRLSDPHDFVRAEIAAGLRNKSRVIPVLVGGASMPRPQDLTPDLVPLSRIEALTLSDTRFHQDMDQLVDALHAIVPAKKAHAHAAGEPAGFPLTRALLAVAALALLLLIPFALHLKKAAGPSVQGSWQATVNYSWGATHREIFQFETDGQALSGTASYVGATRGILDGKIEASRIHFMTKSYTALGEKTYEEKHSYSGVLLGSEIQFTLQTDSGYDSRPPEKFTAKRVVETKP